MRIILFSITLTFLFTPLFAQEDTDDEKVIKVEIVRDTSFEKAEVYGGNEIRVNFLDLLTVGSLHVYYERVLKSGDGLGFSANFNSSDLGIFNYHISPYYRVYFLNREDYGAGGLFAEVFSSIGETEYESYEYEGLREVYVNNKQIQVSFGASIGKKWINRKGYSFEWQIGMGRFLGGENENSSMQKTHGRFGFSVGKRF